VVFAWNLKDGREGFGVGIDDVSDALCDMLIDQEDSDIVSFLCEVLECFFDG
jgi:hypothetical protein